MVRQQAVVYEPEVTPIAGHSEAALDFADQLDVAKGRQASTNPERHVRGIATLDAEPRSVRHWGTRRAFAAGSCPATSPARCAREDERELSSRATSIALE